jgi:hypothetical protein
MNDRIDYANTAVFNTIINTQSLVTRARALKAEYAKLDLSHGDAVETKHFWHKWNTFRGDCLKELQRNEPETVAAIRGDDGVVPLIVVDEILPTIPQEGQ